MKKLIVNGLVGVVLFGGSLVGGLAMTGRLNHEGVANIPVLNSFFPEPPASEEVEGAAGGENADPNAAPAGEAANATHEGTGGEPANAGHDTQDPGTEGPRRTKVGKSAINPEEEADNSGGGGGHGPAADDEADKPTRPVRPAAHTKDDKEAAPAQHAAERDFNARELAMAQAKVNKYAPGGYFTFPGMPAGLTPEKLNEAWQRVQGVLTDLQHKKTVLDQREKELTELAEDISRRHLELGRLRADLDTEQRKLDDRIAKFRDQVKLVRNDEVAALQRNAKTLEAFEADKAAELVTEQWGTEQGQTEILKTFEFMAKDKVNDIIKELANPLIQDILRKRLLVSKESAASEKGRK